MKTPNWLGDLVLFHPALAALRRALPAVRLAVLVPRRLAGFYRATGWIDEVLPHPWPVGWRLPHHLAIATAIRARTFDRALLATRSFESALWVALAGVPRREGVASEGRSPLLTRALREPRAWRRGHPAEVYPALLSELAGVSLELRPAPPEVDAGAAATVDTWLGEALGGRLGGGLEGGRGTGPAGAPAAIASEPLAARAPLAVLAPASAVAAKRWPALRWAALADALAADGFVCVLAVAPWEADVAREVLARTHRPPRVSDRLDPAGLIALLARAALCVGNDSGPSHLAAALGVPTVAVFRRTDPAAGAPRGQRCAVVGPVAGPEGPEVSEVLRALDSLRAPAT